MNRSVVITGANGFVGRNVAKFLFKNGFDVTALARKGRINFVRTINSRDFTEDTLAKKIRNSNVLLHFVGKGDQTVDSDYDSVNVKPTRNVIDLCKKAKIKKIIYISGLGVDKDTTLGYFISKYKAEKLIINSGLEFTIFRSSYIIGSDDHLSQNLKRQMKNHQILIPGSGNYRFQPIYVGDVSKIIIKSIFDKKFSNKILDLVGPQTVTFSRFVRDFIRGTNTKITRLDFERAYHDALHNKGNFGLDDLSIMIGNYTGNHKRLADLAKIRFVRYNEVLKASSLS